MLLSWPCCGACVLGYNWNWSGRDMRNLVLMCQGACKRKELFSVIRMSETQRLVDWMALLSKMEFCVCLELLHFISLPREFPGARYEIQWQGVWNEIGFAVVMRGDAVMGVTSVLQFSGGITQHKRAQTLMRYGVGVESQFSQLWASYQSLSFFTYEMETWYLSQGLR